MNAELRPRPLSGEMLDQTAITLIGAFNARFAEMRRRSGGVQKWSLSKCVAAVTLGLEMRQGCDEAVALAAAIRAVGGLYRLAPAPLKTRGSEARAILTHGLTPAWRDSLSALRPGALLDEIARAMAGVCIQDSLRNRAAELAGARGGRPVESGVLAQVKCLIERERMGDPAARAQLVALSGRLRQWTERMLQASLQRR